MPNAYPGKCFSIVSRGTGLSRDPGLRAGVQDAPLAEYVKGSVGVVTWFLPATGIR